MTPACAIPAVAPPEPPAELERPPLLLQERTPGWISDYVAALAERPAPRWWWTAFGLSTTLLLTGVVMVLYLVSTGMGVWGIQHPVMWGWAIVNFVWWIGIGHAGTLISAILFLMRQRWRTAVSRTAEAMTLFAVMCAALFPILHLGRVWLAWWLLPLPNANSVWPQFRSPLVWDVFAIGTYFLVSLLFWYVGLVPDLATMRDRAVSRSRQVVLGLLALGWRGSARHWHHYERAYLVLAGLCTVLVVSVHSIVSLDFSVSQLPGWHSTLFPPYFVAGAIFSGFGMVLTLLIPLRRLCRLEDLVTLRHVDVICKATLASGGLVLYAHAVEWLQGLTSPAPEEQFLFFNRLLGPYAWAYWTTLLCSVLAPQLFWFKRVRQNLIAVFVLAVLLNVGMWCERFVIVAGSLHRDFVPANWSYYSPTAVDVFTYLGTFGLFFTLFLLFLRFLPMIAMFEVKAITPQADPRYPAIAKALTSFTTKAEAAPARAGKPRRAER